MGSRLISTVALLAEGAERSFSRPEDHPGAEELVAYWRGALTTSEADEIQGHLAVCTECQGMVLDPLLASHNTDEQGQPGVEIQAAWEIFAKTSQAVEGEKAEELKSPARQKAETLTHQVMDALEETLQERFLTLIEDGRDPEEIGGVAAITSRMLSMVPKRSAWNDVLGPFYRTAQIARILGLSQHTIRRHRRNRLILGMKTRDGVTAFPAFQLTPQGETLPGFSSTLSCFKEIPVDDWTLAGWFKASQTLLEGYSVLDWLKMGLDVEIAHTLAQDAARRFQQ